MAVVLIHPNCNELNIAELFGIAYRPVVINVETEPYIISGEPGTVKSQPSANAVLAAACLFLEMMMFSQSNNVLGFVAPEEAFSTAHAAMEDHCGELIPLVSSLSVVSPNIESKLIFSSGILLYYPLRISSCTHSTV